ncbi:hypothetical protein evm_013329 [Chilo suppressalis]|nr:hypothetical protein evm_013329 [Chilo suppressalis]
MMAGTIKLLRGRGLPTVLFMSNIARVSSINLNYLLFSNPLRTSFSNHLRTSSIRISPSIKHLSKPTLFRHLNPDRTDVPKLLRPNLCNFDIINGFPKSFFFRRKDRDPKKRRVPKLILIQNPFTWLMIKIDFSVLRNVWDPSFEESEFKYGTKQAISRVTQVISDGQYAELNGLLTKPARISLMRELERNWSGRQRTLLSLNRDDIQITSPRRVYFIRIADKKFCDVDMAFLALKWVPINSIEALIFTEIFARFHREYTPHSIPEWTIAFFKVTRFEILRR